MRGALSDVAWKQDFAEDRGSAVARDLNFLTPFHVTRGAPAKCGGRAGDEGSKRAVAARVSPAPRSPVPGALCLKLAYPRRPLGDHKFALAVTQFFSPFPVDA